MIRYLMAFLLAVVASILPPTSSFVLSPTKHSITALSARRGRQQPQTKQRKKQQQQSATKSPKPQKVRLHTPQSQITPLILAPDCTVHVAQITSDDPWWEASENPYGARVWPASLGIAQYLWQKQQHKRDRLVSSNLQVLEVGCGAGLVSQTAALAGATVHATDISTTALDLTRQGWKATTSSSTGLAAAAAASSSLTASIYDIHNPLPDFWSSSSNEDSTSLFVASCVLYEGDLSIAMAQRVREAYRKGMWIILGDDDTGNREEGRQKFMDQLQKGMSTNFLPKWTHGSVQCPQLGWREKQFSYLELNAPESWDEEEQQQERVTGEILQGTR